MGLGLSVGVSASQTAGWHLDAQGAINAAKRFLKDNNVQQYILDLVDAGHVPRTWVVRVRLGSIFGPQKDIVVDDATERILYFGSPRAP